MQLVQILPRRWRALAERAGTSAATGMRALIHVLPERVRDLGTEIAKFGVVGVVNLFVNFAVFNLLWFTVLRTGEVKAKAVATIVATTCSYFMNRHWTYRDRPKSTVHREYTLFIIFNAVGLVIEVAVVGVAKYGFGQTHIVVLNLCTGVGIVLGTVFRFWAYRTHVFKLGPEDARPTEPEPPVVSAAAVPAASPDLRLATPANGYLPNPAVLVNGASLIHGAELAQADVVDPDLVDELAQIELAQIELERMVAQEPWPAHPGGRP